MQTTTRTTKSQGEEGLDWRIPAASLGRSWRKSKKSRKSERRNLGRGDGRTGKTDAPRVTSASGGAAAAPFPPTPAGPPLSPAPPPTHPRHLLRPVADPGAPSGKQRPPGAAPEPPRGGQSLERARALRPPLADKMAPPRRPLFAQAPWPRQAPPLARPRGEGWAGWAGRGFQSSANRRAGLALPGSRRRQSALGTRRRPAPVAEALRKEAPEKRA